jgi:hypothetical protein
MDPSNSKKTSEVPLCKTKLNWFDLWFMKKTKEAWAHYNNIEKVMERDPTSYNRISNSEGVTFEIIPCDGGTLIMTQCYDPKSIGSKVGRYVVHDDEDLGKRISEIFSFAALRK